MAPKGPNKSYITHSTRVKGRGTDVVVQTVKLTTQLARHIQVVTNLLYSEIGSDMCCWRCASVYMWFWRVSSLLWSVKVHWFGILKKETQKLHLVDVTESLNLSCIFLSVCYMTNWWLYFFLCLLFPELLPSDVRWLWWQIPCHACAWTHGRTHTHAWTHNHNHNHFIVSHIVIHLVSVWLTGPNGTPWTPWISWC